MKKYNYIITIKSSNNSNAIEVARKITELVPSTFWVRNTPNLLLEDFETEDINTAIGQLVEQRYLLDYTWNYECIKGSPEWVRQYLSESQRSLLLSFLSAIPLSAYLLISGTIAKVMPDLKVAQVLIDSTLCIAVFVFLLFYFWYFNDDDEDSKFTVWLNALMGTTVALTMAGVVRRIIFS